MSRQGPHTGSVPSREGSLSRKSATVSHHSSNISSIIAVKHAKAEAAKVKLQYVLQEAELQKQQASISANLKILETQKEIAEATAEVQALQSTTNFADQQLNEHIDVPIESPEVRTQDFVERHGSVYAHSAQQILHPTRNTSEYDSPPKLSKYEHAPYEQTLNPSAMPFTPTSNKNNYEQFSNSDFVNGATGEITKFLLKKELLLTRLTTFNDRPETYRMWKMGFSSIMSELGVTVNEELDLLIKWLGPESSQHAVSLRSANINNPQRGLQRIWERLEERYGCPEMIEAALKAKLNSFPKLTNRDNTKLYDLSDILSEINCLKEDPKYTTLLSYFDSSSGVIPIVNKLPYNLQEKWTNQASRYKTQHNVPFPPFWFFADFIREISRVKNDPSFTYEYTNSTNQKKDTFFTPTKLNRTSFSAKKTEIDQPRRTNDKESTYSRKCPLHNTNHSLNQCRGFRLKSLDDRQNFLRENFICFNCCNSTEHYAQTCNKTVTCSVCGSNKHASALHLYKNDGPYAPKKPLADYGGEKPETKLTPAATKCTQICGSGFNGKSCSKTILAKVYPPGEPHRAIKAYIIHDDQSNVSLAKTQFFDIFGENQEDIPYMLTSCAGQTERRGRRSHNYVIESLDGTSHLSIQTLIECNEIPSVREEIPTPTVARFHPHLQEISKYIPDIDKNAEILILIGRDVPEAHHVLDQCIGPHQAPYAQRLQLGWAIIGEVCLGKIHQHNINVNKTHILANRRPSLFPPCDRKFDINESVRDYSSTPLKEDMGCDIFCTTKDDNKPGLSRQDREFVKIMDEEVYKDPEGNWVAPLPFKTPRQPLPNNKSQALKRANILYHSLQKNPTKKEHFVTFMQKVFDNKHAELAPPLKNQEECWYLPLFGVYHPQKPEQIRGVFDSSAQHEGISLNDVLLSGPDLTNNLLGVLLRFRKESIAVTADIQSMFHCFIVREDHRNFLRFLWHEDNNPEKPLVDYRMRVHVFGNKPSPAVASYGLLKTAYEGLHDFGMDVTTFVERNFYVDDGLISLPSVEAAIDLLKRTQEALSTHGNLRLHKIASNSRDVMKAFPYDDCASGLTDLNFDHDLLPVQRSLGLVWNLQEDSFSFRVSTEQKPYTRRGVLSTINSIFDPIGFAAPVTIKGKILLRELTTETNDWDEPLSLTHQREWDEWKDSLKELNNINIPRQYTPDSFSVNKEVYVFADASEKAISAVAYLKTTGPDGNQHSGFIIGKAKVAPTHGHTIPRLELCGAVLAAEIAETVSSHLDIPLDTIRYFTDSKVVLGYLYNQSRRFYIYVSNRIDRILTSSRPEQWGYIPTHLNPADLATRGTPAIDLSSTIWLHGPSVFMQTNQFMSESFPLTDPNEDKEVRPLVMPKKTAISNAQPLGTARFSKFSSWIGLVQAVARLRHIAHSYLDTTSCKGWHYCLKSKTVEAFTDAELFIIKQVQHEVYAKDIERIQKQLPLHKDSQILQLDPQIDADGVLRVGGRINRSAFEPQIKNPVIIPGKHHISTLLVRHHHEKVKHQGRLFTEGAVRSAGLWVTGCKRLINSILHACVKCRKLRGSPSQQKMADLPIDRLTPASPFSYVGVDTFGPWSVVTRRTRGGQANSKRWAILFTCLTTRAIHIEVVEEMSSSSFINALRRFIALRGKVKEFWSDRGTNFVGATDDLKVDAVNVEDDPTKKFLYNSGTIWIFNPPHSSHMGGVWERMIGVTRKILDSMMTEPTSRHLTHEVLSTFMAEVVAIINNRPIVPVSTDSSSPFLLTPSILLTSKTDTPLESFNHLDIKDMYRKQWKYVQVLAEQFWKKWRQEYLHTLQTRRKWHGDHPNIRLGDIVLLKEKDIQRNEWPLGIIVDVIPGEDKKVRKVIVRVSKGDKSVSYLRPISEIIFLLRE